MINKLNWDSEFFGFEIGEILNESELNNGNDFKLLILKQLVDKKITLLNFDNTFQETKVVFSKALSKKTAIILDVNDADIDKLLATDLYNLAFESGKHSRFLLDKKFNESQFKELYKKWIDNSINKKFADKIFYIKNNQGVTGFVSIKKHQNHAQIGLIAVDSQQQGTGIGKRLLQQAERYCIENNILELKIPTQKTNKQACSFYKKNGYEILEETIVKHYWKK